MHLQGLQAQGLRELRALHMLQVPQGGMHADCCNVVTGLLFRLGRY
jgi:hypothetical protein